MEKSPAVGLIWKIAIVEAVSSKNNEIFPEHLLCALLKLPELGRESIQKIMSAEADVIEGILAEREQIRDVFSQLEMDTTTIRRTLRKKVPIGTMEKFNQVINRSQASREVFRAADAKAEQRDATMLRCGDLLAVILENPTPAIDAVIQNKEGVEEVVKTVCETPNLDQVGKNILKQEADGGQTGITAWGPQAKTLVSQLSQVPYVPLLMIGESSEDLFTVVHTAAEMMKQDVRNTVRVINYEQMAEAGKEKAQSQIRAVFDELAELQMKIILLLNFDQMMLDDEAFRSKVFDAILTSKNRFILALSEPSYESLKAEEKDMRTFREIWIHNMQENEDDDVPLEL